MKRYININFLRISFMIFVICIGQPAAACAILLMQIFQPASSVLRLSSIDTSALTGYANNKQSELISTLVNGLDIAYDIQVQPNVKNSIALPRMKAGNGFKPYTGIFQNENNSVQYTDRILTVNVGQRDILIDPEDYRSKYLVWLTKPGSSATTIDSQIPFEEYFYQQVIRELCAEINDQTSFFGFDKSSAVVYSGVTVYTAGQYITFTQNSVLKYWQCLSTTTAGQDPTSTPAKWLDVSARAVTPGISSYLTAVTGSNLIATGAITDATSGLNKALQLYQSIPGSYRKAPTIMHCSFMDYDFIARGIFNSFLNYTASDIAKTGYLTLPMSANKCVIKPATWMTGSRRLLLEQRVPGQLRGTNLIMGTDLLGDANGVQVLAKSYQIQMAIKFALGFQISDIKGIWMNDQA